MNFLSLHATKRRAIKVQSQITRLNLDQIGLLHQLSIMPYNNFNLKNSLGNQPVKCTNNTCGFSLIFVARSFWVNSFCWRPFWIAQIYNNNYIHKWRYNSYHHISSFLPIKQLQGNVVCVCVCVCVWLLFLMFGPKQSWRRTSLSSLLSSKGNE